MTEPLKKLLEGVNYITPAGYQQLSEEYDRLRRKERPEIVDVIAWAASNGDRSENGDYIYGKKRLREIDKRLRFLQRQMDKAQIVDPANIDSDEVYFGATVEIEDDSGQTQCYAIVGTDETDPEQGKISWRSPLAKALFRSKAGDLVTYVTPKGERDVEVLSVAYKQIL